MLEIPEAAAGVAAIGLAVHFRGVLDHAQIMFARHLKDRIKIDRQTVDVHQHDRAGPRRDRGLDGVGRHVPGHRIAIDDHRSKAGANDGGGAADNRKGRDDDLCAGFEAERMNRNVERDGSVRDRDAVTTPRNVRHGGFEACDERPLGRYPSGAHALGQIFSLVSVEQRRVDWNEILLHATGPLIRFADAGASGKRVLSFSPA